MHSAFSDNAYFAATIKNFGKHSLIQRIYNYIFKTGPHLDIVDTNLDSYTVDQWYAEYRNKIVSWLNLHVPTKSGI